MRKLICALFVVALTSAGALGQSQSAPTLRIVSEDGNNLPSELMYGNTRVKPLRLRPGTNVPITIDDSDFFVQQQYVDFLSRFPDQSGFQFWLDQINSCGANARCIDGRRTNTSGAFFLSIEFQETGYLVYKTHKAAFGNISGKPVPVRRESFMPETRSIGNGVVVGTPGWENVLLNNKNAYMAAFVQRADFRSAFPAGMTPTEFVNQLDQRAGSVLDAAERTQLINDLTANNTDAGRAAVLRRVAEDTTLHQAEFNKAFVLMQYFGYLRRNPDDSPDSDFAGYAFWLGKLNQFNGNFHAAEMVRSFLVSGEYRTRF